MKPLTLFVCALLLSPAVSAQDAPEQASPGQVHWEQAIALYSERDYASAIPLIIEAIQADPTDPRYYRGLARAAHFADQFDLATRYYDIYLEHYAAHANSASGQDNDEAAIRRERDRANSRREAPTTPVELPPFQIAALDSLHERLEGGPYLSADNTGAHAMFETLLRTGYAEPHLAEVRGRLAAGLRDETDTLFLSRTAAAVPLTTLDEWRRIPERLEALDDLGVSDLDPSVREARLAAARE